MMASGPSYTPSLAARLETKRLVVLVGEGGVGKTSTAAALAYGQALAGRDVAVVTVDPAPRLGDALGISKTDGAPPNVALPATPSTAGSLVAMRLDAKHTFDRMVERYAPTRDAAQALLRHPVYQAVSGSLGGSEHYMAFQHLAGLAESAEHDLLVIDTPPAVTVSELLAAPARLAGLLDAGALSILAEPARLLARATSAMARASLSLVLAAVGRVAGDSLKTDVGEFGRLFSDILVGLEDNTRIINDRLRSRQTAFVMVARPRVGDIARAIAFREELARIGLRIDAIVVNRLTPPGMPPLPSRAERLADALPQVNSAIRLMEREMDSLRRTEAEALAKLRAAVAGTDTPMVIPLTSLDADVATLEDVARLARGLFGGAR